MKKTVVELFAGIGGFRVGLNNVVLDTDGETVEQANWEFKWTNQWEPSTKKQHAFVCYEKRFGTSDSHSNLNITKVNKKHIPSHSLLVGGFPCQDYSVARGLSGEKGIQGKKGVLWWEIYKILKIKRTPFVLLENVDRLLKSPSTQRGRDFGIMLKSFHDLGYGVEWRVINAAEHGFPQRRKRIFIFAFRKSTRYYKNIRSTSFNDVLYSSGFFSKEFKVKTDYVSNHKNSTGNLLDYDSLFNTSTNFSSAFRNSGIMMLGKFLSIETKPIYQPITPLSSILQKRTPRKYYIEDEKIKKLMYLKSSKRIPRIKPDGTHYIYSEGTMKFPDNIDSPGRTMLTSEGTSNRSTHVIQVSNKSKLRLITPLEAERLNGFPDNWTNTNLSDRQRYFLMGNALVCGIVSRLSPLLEHIITSEK